jgi:putative hydrolase of the HAD superfamily
MSTGAAPDRCARTAARRPTIRAVCLDVDDTLIDYGASARSALGLLLDALLGPAAPSLGAVWPLWQEITDRHSAAVVAGRIAHSDMRRQRTKAFFTHLGRDIDDTAADRGEDLRLAAMQDGWQLFDDALPCLDWLRAAGLKLAVITNATGPRQDARLAGLGVGFFFETIIAAGDVGAAKPDPAIFHTACHGLGVPPEETLHIGDRLDLDAQGAANAGLHGVWLNRTPNPPAAPTQRPADPATHSATHSATHPAHPAIAHPTHPAIHTITSLGELPELLIDGPWDCLDPPLR